ncbi:enhancer of mRNA-decapping protein 3-like isoform X2 [Limulus polyphemus]|uniref:Enhancer of mRNA-decapping protein 3 n=1 Tax=Limulus polyphemus TaxID=6850 RepID=A0ABM1B2B6_LIMPO|nr:enhancer of mRNA-decapping protein 3-like isoform X2 [Limulus polyphemus]
MADRWIGCEVVIDCGDVLGVFQGRISEVDTEDQTITLVDFYRNGVHSQYPHLVVSSQDICDLKILHTAEDLEKSSHNQVDHCLNKTSNITETEESFSSPAKVEEHNKRRGDGRKKITTPKKIEGKKRLTERDEACFSAPVDSYILEHEFDFEKNLALFDKQAIFEEIEAHSKPDVVRLVDINRRQTAKYRCDENVLLSEPVTYREITVPCVVEKEYVTDTGLVVPSISKELRSRLIEASDRFGFSTERRLEMAGRAASEMVLQLAGGNHRLNPQNSHQRPTAVVICTSHQQGAQAVNCGRHLANHGVQVTVLHPAVHEAEDLWFTKELKLFKLTGGKTTSSVADLLPKTVDIILVAIDEQLETYEVKIDQHWYNSSHQWASHCKAPLLLLDPPPEAKTISDFEPKWILVTVLPSAFPSSNASLYLCDLGLPGEVFSDVGIRYASPFGSKFVIPLYNKDS